MGLPPTPPPPPTLGEVMRDTGQEEVVAYVARQQNMAENYIMKWPILDLCTEAEHWPGAQVSKQWWYQEAIDILGEQEAAIYSEGGDGSVPTWIRGYGFISICP